jgi:hypothetical protein
MAFVVADRVMETTLTTGTGTYTLAGAVTGHQSFAAIGNGNTTYFGVTDGINWEICRGVYTSSGTTLTRASVRASSNGGAAVSWGAGQKIVFCVDPGSDSLWNLAAGLITTDGAGTLSVTAKGTSDGNVPTFISGGINFEDKFAQRPILLDMAEKQQSVTHSSAGNLTIDVTAGNVVALAQSANITSMTISNPSPTGNLCSVLLVRTKDASGTARTIVWPSGTKHPGGAAPTLTQTTGAIDRFILSTSDAGSTWFLDPLGAAYA